MDVRILGDSLVVTPDKRWQAFTVSENLQHRLLLPATYVHKLFTDNRVQVGKSPVTAEDRIGDGRKLRLIGEVEEDYGVATQFPMATTESKFVNPVDVLYEDDHILVVNKPAGVIIYPSDESDVDTLAHRMAQYYALTGQMRKVRHVHRLDKDTTGAIIYAKHGYAARALDALLLQRRIDRTYLALVQGRTPVENGVVELPIGRDRHMSGRYRVSETGKPAITHYRCLCTARAGNGQVSLIECHLETGRTHQIRVHMSAIGCPIVGDVLYGGGTGVGGSRIPGQALHALRVAFPHPYLETEIDVQAPLPHEFSTIVANLGMTL